MKKKKKVKINFGNLFILVIIIGLGIYGIKTLYLKFNDDKKENNNTLNKSETNDLIDKLVNIGYSKKESEEIINNLDKSVIENINKKYEYLNEFSKIKYFHIENIERYINLKNNSEYDFEEVVMRVNTDLDHDYYTDIETITNTDDLLILVNKYHALPDDYEPKDLIKVGSQYMQREAGEQMNKLLKDINDSGLYLQAQSGYRSISTQRSIYNRYVRTYGQEYTDTVSARPTHSEHHTGLAMDLSHDGTLEKTFENTKQFEWLQENAYKYGFIMRYPKDKIYMTGYDYEPWHYRYVGVEIATLIKNENITFEEYYVKYKGLY